MPVTVAACPRVLSGFGESTLAHANNHKTGRPATISIGVGASLVSSALLMAVGAFWLLAPGAAEAAFGLSADTPSAQAFAGLVAIFKGVSDILPAVFVLIGLMARQFRLVGYFHVVTLVLVIVVDIITWQAFVPEPSLQHVVMHLPFALPMIVAACCFLGTRQDQTTEGNQA